MTDQVVVHEELYIQLTKFVGKRVQRREDVSDLVQDIFLKLHEKGDDLRDQDLIMPWLYRVARNRVIDYYRKNGRVEPVMPETVGNEDDEVFQEVSSWVRLFIGSLSEEDQEILELVEFQGLTQKEAAQKLGLKPDAAKARHQRSKKRLKAALEKCCAYSVDARGKVIDFEANKSDDCCD